MHPRDSQGPNTAPAAVALVFVVSVLSGLGIYTFTYARGYSYLMNDSAACANCHVMQAQYDGWVKSSHRKAATCNDCHTPSGFLAGYGSKAINGFNHSLAMTTGRFEEPVRIKGWNRAITEQACAKCHQDNFHNPAAVEGCVKCHSQVGHP